VGGNPEKSNQRWCAVLMLSMGVLGVGSGAAAQSLPQLDLNQFRPSELATDGFAVSNADGQGHLRFGVQLYMDFSRDPLELKVTNGPIPDARLALLHSQLTGHLVWSLGLWERLVVFMDLPYSFMLKDDLSTAQAAFLDSIGRGGLVPRGRGVGDLYVGARGVLYGERDNVFQLAAQATLTANTASAADAQQNYLGEPNRSPNIGGWFEVLGTFNAGEYVRIPLNLGYKTNFTQDVPSLDIGNQLTFGGAVQVLLGQERFMLTVESFGRTAAASGSGFGGSQETPIELLGGFKYFHRKGFAVGVAGTGGVTSGYGNPDWRLIGMLAYTMPARIKGRVVEEPLPPPDPDRDGDGVPDRIDDCPDDPGPIENQGCPEAEVVVIEAGGFEILDKIYFNVDSAKLQRRSYAVLDSLARVLNEHPEVPIIRVEGHTDQTGPAEYNMRLSQRRAESVARYLVDPGGVAKGRLVAQGFGETRPLVPDAKTKAALAQNRRVEFHVVGAGADEGDAEPAEP
jgi:outer membrane protein OmpA-like peptidoglycan-associated protein